MPEAPSAGRRSRPLAAAALLAVVVSFAPIASHSLWTPDEPTGAGVGRTMLASGDLVLPRLGGRPFLEKPPLYWWAQVAGYRLLGVSDATARLPSALFAIVALLAAYALGRRVGGPSVGLATVAVLATTAEWSEDMGRCVVDPALAAFVTLAYLGFAGVAAPESAGDRRRSLALVALALPLAFLSKGVVGVGLAAGPPALYLLATERRRGLRKLLGLAALAVPVFLLLVVPWARALLHDGGWAALRETLVGNTVGRFFSTSAGRVYGHRRSILYYLGNAPAFLFPWLFALPAVVAAGVMRRGSGRGGAGEVRARTGRAAGTAATAQAFTALDDGAMRPTGPAIEGGFGGPATVRAMLVATFVVGAALLSLAASKRGLYLVPLLPALAVAVAWWLEGNGAASRWDRPTRLGLLGLGALLPVLVWGAALWARFAPPPALAGLSPLRDELSPRRLAFAGLLALVAAGAFVARLARARKEGPALRTGWIVAPYLLVFLALQTAGKAAVDPVKDLHELTGAIALFAPGAGPVPLYVPAGVPTDSIFGILDFDLGRRPLLLETPGELASFLAAHPGARVALSVESARRLPADLRARLAFVYDEIGRRASPWAIAEESSPPPATSGGAA